MQQVREMEAAVKAAPDQQISLTDPAARSMATSGRGTGIVGRNVRTAVDAKHHLIVAHEVVNCADAAAVARSASRSSGSHRFPGELRLPGVACIIRVQARIQRGAVLPAETRCHVSSANLDAERAGQAVRGHRAIENSLHWVLDVTFGDDQSRLRKGQGAKNMAAIRHRAPNRVRAATDKRSIRLRRKLATWTSDYLEHLPNADTK